MKYLEIVENGIRNRNKIIREDEYNNTIRAYEAYISIYRFTADIVKYVNETKTVTDYMGEVSMPTLWIDIDTKTKVADTVYGRVEDSIIQAKAIIERLHNVYSVPYESIIIYFSGNKGFHIGIKDTIFDGSSYCSEYVPTIAKDMALLISESIATIDTTIYNTTRIFRCPLSRHQESGYYKIPIDYNLILEMNTYEILRLAAGCETNISYQYVFSKSNSLSSLFLACVNKATSEIDIVSQKEIDTSRSTSLFSIPEEGSRNDTMFRQAYRLFNTDLKTNEVVDIINRMAELTNAYSVPNARMSDFEIRGLINSAYKRSRSKPIAQFVVQSLSGMIEDSFDTIINSKVIPTRIPEFDLDLDGGLSVGNLYPFIGLGGTMKSLLAQDIFMENAIADDNFVGLYNNMEMSQVQWVSRAIRKLMQREFKNAVKFGQITRADIQHIEHTINVKLSNRLLVVNQNDLSAADTSTIIKQCEDIYKKKVTGVVNDSMNGMKMHNDNEGMTAFLITKELKEVCKNDQVALILINHVKTGVDPYLQDCSGFVRGGQKVLDNGDAYFSLSLIADQERSNFSGQYPDYIPLAGYVNVRLKNKRETGNTINKIIMLDTSNDKFDMIPLDIDPAIYTKSHIRKS